MKLIAVVGKKRSGKDTVADFIVNDLNGAKYQLAAPIKERLGSAYDVCYNNKSGYPKLKIADFFGEGEVDRERNLLLNNADVQYLFELACTHLHHRIHFNLEKAKFAARSVTLNNIEPWNIRRLMQTLGTDVIVDGVDRMLWMKLFALDYMDMMSSDKEFYVVPDVRQVHEIDTLRAMGATIIHVVRPEQENEQTDTHITEAGLPIEDGDKVITNDGTIEELYENVKEILCQ